MSQLSDYISQMLTTEYEMQECLKKTEQSVIEIYKNRKNEKKLVKICSTNRNDHIYRTLRGRIHPNTATVYDVSSEEDGVIVLEKFIEGELLTDKLKNGPLEEARAVSYVLDLCCALSFLHGLNVIHRDIKPSNVIINEEDRAVLIDYSSSRELSYTSDGDTIKLGTPGYAAPEQYGVYQSVPATDIYALGVLFNVLLLGMNPIIKTPKGKLGKIIKRCTSSQISQRYQNIGELEKELKRYKKFHR